MPDLVEQMYCSQQIIIPPNLPSILKKYAKAAIRTQPYDLLVWSSAYFRAICDGIPPPVKERIEYPPPISESGLSPGFLKVLINQIGKGDTVPKELLESRWKGVCLNLQYLDELICVGGFCDDIDWKKFIAIAAGSIESNLTRTMVLICELMTDEPEGGSASVPLELFIDLYKFLAQLDCGPVDFRKKPVSETETVCPQITASDQPVTCDCRSDVSPQVTWEQALAGKENDNEDVNEDEIDVNEAETEENQESNTEQEVNKCETEDMNKQEEENQESNTEQEDNKCETEETNKHEEEEPQESNAEQEDNKCETEDINHEEEENQESNTEQEDNKCETEDLNKQEEENQESNTEQEVNKCETEEIINHEEEENQESNTEQENNKCESEDMNKQEEEINEQASETEFTQEEKENQNGDNEVECPVNTDQVDTESIFKEDGQVITDNQKTDNDADESEEKEEEKGETGNTESEIPDKEEKDGVVSDEITNESGVNNVEGGMQDDDDDQAVKETAGEIEECGSTQEEEDIMKSIDEQVTKVILESLTADEIDGEANDSPEEKGTATSKADLEKIDSGFSVETMVVEQGNLFNVWPLIEEDVEETEGEEEVSDMADSAYGVQVWDDTFGSSSYEMLYAGEERLMGEEDFKNQSGVGPDVIVLEPPESSNLDAEEYFDEDQADSEILKKPRESEDMEDVFAPKIDSLREILDDEYVGEQEGEEIDVVDQESSKESDEPVFEEEEEKEVVGEVIEDNIVTIIEPDADIHHLPTPVTSEISVLIEEQAEGETSADAYDPSQKLAEKQSLIDVRVIAEEPVSIEEEQEKEVQAHDPFWKFIPGIGPIVPDEIIEEVIAYLQVVASYQSHMIMPKNLRHFKCPPLEAIEN